MAFVDEFRDRYHDRLTALLCSKLPPEIVHAREVNEKRELDRRGLTLHEETFHVSRQHWIVLVRPAIGLLSGLVPGGRASSTSPAPSARWSR